MTSKKPCEPCSRSSKSSTAVKYCSDCDEALCSECYRVHGTFKAFTSHHVVDANISSDQAFTVNKLCTDHEDMNFEFYCCDHDCLCCRSCIADSHRFCGKIKPLDVAARGVRDSTMSENISKEVTYLNTTASQLRDEKEKNITVLKNRKAAIRQEIGSFKSKIFTLLDEIERKLIPEVDTMYEKAITKAEDDQEHVQKRTKDISNISSRFEFVVKHGSESQIFLLLNELKTEVNKGAKDLQELIPSQTTSDLVFEESDLLSVIKSLGSVTIKISPSNVQYQPPKAQKAQDRQQYSHIPTRFQFESKIQVGAWITGMAFTRDNKLILCNRSDSKVTVITDKGKHLGKIDGTGCPWGIALVPDTDEAWVTVPDRKHIQFINTATMKSGRNIVIPDRCYGITLLNDDIAVGGIGEIYIVSKEGKHLKTLQVGKKKIYSLYFGKNSKLYCCEADSDKFHCIELDGTIEFSYDSSDLRGPIDVESDVQGNVYVIGYISNNLHRLSPDGKLIGVTLKETDELDSPYAIAFNKKYSKIFIANEHDKYILIFSCI